MGWVFCIYVMVLLVFCKTSNGESGSVYIFLLPVLRTPFYALGSLPSPDMRDYA